MTLKTKNNNKGHDGYKQFPCDVCGSTDAIGLPHERKYTKGQNIYICKKCGFIYVNKRRPYSTIAQVWSQELFGKAYTSKTPLMLARHIYIAEFIDQSIGLKNKKVCDIGAGEGQFLNIVKNNYSASVFGIEPSKENCKIIKKYGIKCFQGTLEKYIKRSQRKADIVTLMWTLENATSCKDILIGAHKILKEKGHLVIATGSRILVPPSKPLHFYLNSNPADAHPSRFSANTLSALLSITGFKVIHVNPYLNDGLALCMIAKKTNKKIKIKGDDFQKVYDFFKRWHIETQMYYRRDK